MKTINFVKFCGCLKMSQKYKFAVIVDPRGIIVNSGQRVIDRHFSYDQLLQDQSDGNVRLKVLSRQITDKHISMLPYNFHLYANLGAWFIRSWMFLLRHRSQVLVLIAGEPWFSFWTLMILKWLTLSSARVQVQLHGDFATQEWLNIHWSNRMRMPLLYGAIRCSDSVRFVSKMQLRHGTFTFPVVKDKAFISSVEFSLGEFSSRPLDLGKVIQIGVIGRLQIDKGVDTAIKFIECLKVAGFRVFTTFVGDGPNRSEIERLVDAFSIDHKFTGHLEGETMEETWSKLDLILSMAPAESYGLVPREAIARGIRVIGLENGGINQLFEDIGEGQGLIVIPQNWSCKDAIRVLNSISMQYPSEITRSLFQMEIRTSKESLIKSWLNGSCVED